MVTTKKKHFFKNKNKSQFIYLNKFLNICPYIGSPKSGNCDLVIFLHFLNFGPFLRPFLRTVLKNTKIKIVAPDQDLKFFIGKKILALICGSLKYIFQKCTFRGPQLNRLGLVPFWPGMAFS